MNINTIGIKVQTTGVTQGARELDNLGVSAGKTEKKILSLIDSVDKMVAKFNSSAGSAQAMNTALATVNRSTQASDAAMKALAASVGKLASEVSSLGTAMSRGTAVVDRNRTAIVHHTTAMSDAHAMARGLTGSLGALWLTYGNMVPLAAGAAIGASLKEIVVVGADVENTLEAIRLKTGATSEEMVVLAKTVADVGRGIYGPQEVAKALEVLGLAGLNATESVAAVGAALNLATSGGTTIEKSAEALVTIGTAIGATSKEYDYLADAIQKTANVSLASVDSIAESVKRASVVNKLYGASFEDILTQTAALSQLGIKNSAAGTAITNFYANAMGGTEKAKKAMKELGFSFQDATGKAKPLVAAYEEFTAKLNKFDQLSQKKIIMDIFGERALRDVEGLRDLVNQAAKSTETLADGTLKYKNRLQEVQAEIKDSAGSSVLIAAEQALTTTNRFKSVGNELKSVFAEAFTSIQPTIENILRKLKELFESQAFVTTVRNIANGAAWLAEKLVDCIGPLTAVAEGFLAVGFATAGGAIFTRMIPSVQGFIAVVTGAIYFPY